MSGSGLIILILSGASTFDYTWLSKTAWAGGVNPMTVVLLLAGILIWHVDTRRSLEN